MSGSSSKENNDFCRPDEAVDPRVQIELERLNAATDEINKLEVDLDEARANFRQLLYESSLRIDAIGKKLGNCVEKARPYYEARIKAKEALQETQMAAVRFERANSAHAAAKEMVYLAEEGLCAEGRTFDHAWQEMLNHATMRVNESELERTLSEDEHRRTSHSYQQAEVTVQQLQKELKRSIAKSSYNIGPALSHCNVLPATLFFTGLPYFEMKAQFNQLLEEQKRKVKCLEIGVSSAKSCYAEALHNLEQISDEIHRIRKNHSEMTLGTRSAGVGADSPLTPIVLSPDSRNTSATVSSSTNPDTDHWTDSVGSSDSEIQEEYLRLPDKLGISSAPIIPRDLGNLETWSDVSLTSPEYERYKNEVWTEVNLNDSSSPGSDLIEHQDSKVTSIQATTASVSSKSKLDSSLSTWISRSSVEQDNSSRRQSLDTLILGGLATGERVKEILSQGIMKLNISSLTDRRSSEPKFDKAASSVRLPATSSASLSVKKVPSPLEKSMIYLHPEDDTTSDSESLASVEMLTDDQISSLMLEQDLQEVCQNVLGSPISVTPQFASQNHL